ncbi:MAG TPA: DUF3943 domain-containing protein [Polyangia bacterium]|nr:DUF3943 domain-containing protein [Polyangia bacterium]
MGRKAVILSWGLATVMSVSAAAARGAEARDPETDTDAAPAAARPEHPYLRIVLGELAFLGLQAAWYWGHQDPSESEIPLGWQTWQTKMFSDRYFAFDHDRFNTNAIGHPLAGTIYYQIARGNGLGVGPSFLTTVAASTLWKYFGEPNQKLSINDLIVTPAAGWVIGEATYRLGRLFADGEPNLTNCVGAALFSPVAALNDAPVCHGKRRQEAQETAFGEPYDERGISRRIWHRLSFELGAAHTSFEGTQGGNGDGNVEPNEERNETVLGLGARIVSHALYRRPGSGASTARPGQWTDLGARWFINDGSIRGAFVHADSLVWGRYWRDYGEVIGASGEPDGRGLLLGVGSSFDYDARSLPNLWDRTLAVGLLGPVAEFAARHGSLALRATLAASYGFAQVTSLAYAEAAPAFANVIIKSELKMQGYYYAQGLLTFATVEAELKDLRLTLDGRSQSLWSFNLGDDQQAELQNNFSLRDTRLYLSAIASWQPFGGPVRLALAFDDVIRDSRLPGTLVSSDERRVLGSILLVF